MYKMLRATSITMILAGMTAAAFGATMSVIPGTVIGGTTCTGRVGLPAVAPTGGTTVFLSSSNSALAEVPATVVVPAGRSEASFIVSTAAAQSSANVAITATTPLGTASSSMVVLTPRTVHYVAPNGSDSNAGTLAAPWKTLRKGLTSARAGDLLYVRGGTYVENLGGSTPITTYPGTATAPVLIKAYPNERPVLQGLLRLNRPSYWTLDGINVTWNVANSSSIHMVKISDGVGWTLRNCEIWGARSYAAMLVCSSRIGEPADWYIGYNTIHDTIDTGAHSSGQDHLIYVNSHENGGPGHGGLIERNVLYNCANGTGIKLGGSNSSEGGPGYMTVQYNTIYNTFNGVGGGWQAHDNTVRWNTIVRCYSGRDKSQRPAIYAYQLTGSNDVAYSNLWYDTKGCVAPPNTGYLGYTDLGGEFRTDPLFDTLAMGGFHPLAASAACYGVYCP